MPPAFRAVPDFFATHVGTKRIRARERPAPAASPPLACSRLRWRGSEIIILDLQDEDQWESLVSDEEDDEDDDSDDDA